MSRKWTARKTTTLDEAAIDPAAFAPAYPVFRAGPAPAEARKQVLRLLTGFTLLGLPVHLGIGWLAGHSLGLATAAVVITVAALLAVAVARWLALEELLQRLPLLLGLGLVGVGLVFITSLPAKGWGAGGFELFGTVFILITVVSILGGLYRPLAAAYQTVTLKIPFRDLCVAAAAMLVSLGLAAAGQCLPRPALQLLSCVLAGTFAGLVVTEYAAWARANPGVSLERLRAFDGPATDARGRPRKPAGSIDGGAALLGAALFGISYGLFVTDLQYHAVPPPADDSPGAAGEAPLFLVGIVGVPFGLVWASTALNALRFPNPFLAARLARDALVVFLTYPETSHPLAHRVHTPWLRPLSVRLAGAGMVLATAASAFVMPPAQSPATVPGTKAAASGPAAPPPDPPVVYSRDAEAAHIVGWGEPGFGAGPLTPPPPVWMPPTVQPPVPAAEVRETRSVGDRVARFCLAALAVAVMGPAFLYAMVVIVGSAVLPTYFRYFETPETPGSPR